MEVEIIRSNRKTLAIQINADLTVTVRAPRYALQRDIDRILKEKEPWIRKHTEKLKQQQVMTAEAGWKAFTGEEIRGLTEQAQEEIPKRVEHFAKIIGVDYGRITIRNQKTRWGSCSSKGNLNFNCLLMLAPPEIIDYVVVHELCHRKEMNHSKAFWHEVETVLPNYRTAVKWLKTEGRRMMLRMSGIG